MCNKFMKFSFMNANFSFNREIYCPQKNPVIWYTELYCYTLTTRLVSSVPISCTNLGTTPLVITCCIHSTLPSVTYDNAQQASLLT